MIAAQNSLKSKSDLSVLYDAVEVFAFGAVTGKSLFRSVGAKDSYAMIVIAGQLSLLLQLYLS